MDTKYRAHWKPQKQQQNQQQEATKKAHLDASPDNYRNYLKSYDDILSFYDLYL